MLVKLIKHELKATYKLIFILQVVMLVTAIFGRFFLISLDKGDSPYALTVLFVLLYIMVIVVASYGTIIIYTMRFYKNLFTDEGYLMFTLPATPGQLLLSKTIVGSLWGMLDMIIVFISLYLTFSTPKIIAAFIKIKPALESELDFNFSSMFFAIIGISIIGCISSAIMIYFCITVGQLFSRHRILASVIAYLVLTVILQMIVLAVMAIFGFFPMIGATAEEINNIYSQSNYMMFSLKLGTFSSILTSAICYVAAYFIMNKKINLN